MSDISDEARKVLADALLATGTKSPFHELAVSMIDGDEENNLGRAALSAIQTVLDESAEWQEVARVLQALLERYETRLDEARKELSVSQDHGTANAGAETRPLTELVEAVIAYDRHQQGIGNQNVDGTLYLLEGDDDALDRPYDDMVTKALDAQRTISTAASGSCLGDRTDADETVRDTPIPYNKTGEPDRSMIATEEGNMGEWQYLRLGSQGIITASELNRHSKNGWELVTVIMWPDQDQSFAYLKRPANLPTQGEKT